MTFIAIICDLCAEDQREVRLATHRCDAFTRTGIHLCESHAASVNVIIANMVSRGPVDTTPSRPVRVPAFNQLP